MKRISVVIPTYNREALIETAVRSVIGQGGAGEAFKITEIVVVDDCSMDNTAAVIEEFAKSEEKLLAGIGTKLIYHRMEQNSGPGAARNVGAKLSSGEYIAFQDSDDYWFPNKLRVMTEFMETSEKADMYCHYYEAKLDGDRRIIVDAPSAEDYFEELAVRNFVGAPTILVKKDAFMDIGGFDEEMRALEDWDFALRFAYGHKIRFVPQVLMEVDLVGEGVSSKAGNYYDARCRLIARNKGILMEREVFKAAVEKLLNDAKEKGILKEVGAILESYIMNYSNR